MRLCVDMGAGAVVVLGAALGVFSAAPQALRGNIRVLKLSEAKAFQMGNVKSVRVVSPEIGARRLTLNYSVSEPSYEFPQHVHDGSDDTFLVLEGEVDVRQGQSRRPLRKGEAAFVPAGQVHGTVTTGTGTAILISFQCPPDMALYTGARDSSRPGAPAPVGTITPGAVKLVNFGARDGLFVHPAMGAIRAAAAHRTLRRGESLAIRTTGGQEALLFVWRGAVSVRSPEATYSAGERDTVFLSAPVSLTVESGANEAELIYVESPPGLPDAHSTGPQRR